MKNPRIEEKRRTEVERTELDTMIEPDLWRSFELLIRAGNTNRPVTEWCNPSKAPPHSSLNYGTPSKNTRGRKAALWSRLI